MRPERMTNHWWWRPGVRPFRRVYVWHILFADQPGVAGLARRCHERLTGIPGLDPVPARWLHMTTQVVGFADQIAGSEVTAMVEAVTKRLQCVEPVPVVLGELLFHSEAVVLGIRPPRALHPVREGIRDAVASTVRNHRLDDEADWSPHLAVAYSNADGPAATVFEAMTPTPAGVDLLVDKVTLVSQERIDHSYRWDRVADVPFGVA